MQYGYQPPQNGNANYWEDNIVKMHDHLLIQLGFHFRNISATQPHANVWDPVLEA